MVRNPWPVALIIGVILVLLPGFKRPTSEFELTADAPVAASVAAQLRILGYSTIGPITRLAGLATISSLEDRPVGVLLISFIDRTGRSTAQESLPLVQVIRIGTVERIVFSAHAGIDRFLVERETEQATIGRLAIERGGVVSRWEVIALSPRVREPAWLERVYQLVGETLGRALAAENKR